jgi:glycosyltransferase involved in cell wall biosynthesis
VILPISDLISSSASSCNTANFRVLVLVSFGGTVSNLKPVKVSLGIPVYNGERFVATAIQSALDQTFTDFELIICDNASTDQTAEICEEFVRKDSRIRYIRQEINIGAKANFNRVFEYARGEYFKWIAADDVCGPTLSGADCCRTGPRSDCRFGSRQQSNDQQQRRGRHTRGVGPGGIFDEGFPVQVRRTDRQRRFDAVLPHKRFGEILLDTFWCLEIFALIRRDAMLLTYPKRGYYGSDKVVLAQLSLLGRFVEVPDVQFFRRAHHGNSTNLTIKDREKWSHAPKTHWKLPTQFPCLKGYTISVLTFPLSFSDRLKCLGVIATFVSRPDRYRSLARQLLKLQTRRKIKRVGSMPVPEVK